MNLILLRVVAIQRGGDFRVGADGIPAETEPN